MKRLLLVMLLLPALVSAAPTPRIALFYNNGDVVGAPAGTPTELMCLQRLLEQGGWAVDRYNASLRTWGGAPDTSDAEWFASRYVAVVIAHGDFYLASVVTSAISGYGTNFQNSAGIARASSGPLGGRWKIPTLVLGKNVVPTTTFNDTSSNTYVAGIQHTPAAFSKPAVGTAGTWRYRLLARLTGSSTPDTLYADPAFYACRPSPWTGAGEVAALIWADTTNGLGTCVGADTIMVAWRWQPRSDRPGVYYTLLRSDYANGICDGALWVLQTIATITPAKPFTVIPVQFNEHNPGVVSLTDVNSNNYVAYRRKLTNLGIHVNMGPVCPGDLPLYNSQIGQANIEAVNKGAKWYSFASFQATAFADTPNVKQAFLANANCSTHPDSMMFPKSGYYRADIVSSQGKVGARVTGVLADHGVQVITSLIGADLSNWYVPIPTSQAGPMIPFIVPDGTKRILYVRATAGLGDNETFTARVAANGGRGNHEYVGSVFIKNVSIAATRGTTLFHHTSLNIGSDPYHQWLFGDVLAKHFRYYNKIIKFDATATLPFYPQPQ